MVGDVPPLDPRPMRSMVDMSMGGGPLLTLKPRCAAAAHASKRWSDVGSLDRATRLMNLVRFH
jgi:hypothetical protein